MAPLDHNHALLTDLQSAFLSQDRALSWACSVCFHTMALAVAAVSAVSLREVPQAPTLVSHMEFLLTDPQSEADQTASPDSLGSANPAASQETAALAEDSSPVTSPPPPSIQASSAEVVEPHPVNEPSKVQPMERQVTPAAPALHTTAKSTAASDPVPMDGPMPIKRPIEPMPPLNESRPPTDWSPSDAKTSPVTETVATNVHDHAELSSPVPPERAQHPVEASASVAPASPHNKEAASLPQTDLASATDSQTGDSGSSATSSSDTVALNHPTIARAVPATQHLAWLTELLRRQILSLQAYPHRARTQGWEGIVIVKTTIKSDGTLVEAVVTKSSGYDALDEDALQLMHRVCPIHLPRDLGQSQIAVMIPIRYRLDEFN
ncbi:energy transducer TonB [Nitrospira lenta]|uniref:TonB C-terminal domain-containing protein n=1 Tax=Nitrospira lenta TaxID=1436998 RepID=A0A330L2D2_9BACT|nr:energy transducer TonB [Nitrospira lenta]SPP63379.1 hypothetical protein NITLEN_10465 [Nitrospira lenta]